MGIDNLGQTSTKMTTEIDVTTDGEYAEHDEVKIVMTGTQADKLVELLDTCVDLDTVGLDWNEPETVLMVKMLIETIRNERSVAREAAEASE